jgi:RNA polymerase sigma factor for flagellar operon FliA
MAALLDPAATGIVGDDAAALWRAYAQDGAPQRRERLVTHYLPFARMLAAKMFASRTHMQVEFDEYQQLARIGLIEAVDRFDPARGYKFETYATSRINGAILSGMEAYSEVHEQVAARKRVVTARMESLKDANRAAGEPADVFAYLAELAIGLAVGFALDDPAMYRDPEGSAQYQDNTYTGVELKQLRARIRALLDGLPGKQRQVIAYHYLQQLAFEEIAGMLQVSRGRVSQIHKEALLALRAALRSQQELNWSG